MKAKNLFLETFLSPEFAISSLLARVGFMYCSQVPWLKEILRKKVLLVPPDRSQILLREDTDDAVLCGLQRNGCLLLGTLLFKALVHDEDWPRIENQTPYRQLIDIVVTLLALAS